jgi:hypothetical protein
MPLTPDAKKLLAETIRGSAQSPEKGIRALLLRAIHDEADRRYRLSVPIGEAGLDEAHRRRRERIEAWLAERVRTARTISAAETAAARVRLLRQAEKDAAATFVNRLFLVRQLEALGLSKPPIVTGGWSSKGYREFREFASGLTADETEGYATLLRLVFDELAERLPGLFGDVGLTSLLPIPASMLREVIERLDDPGLASAWTDDTTLGWVYQFWNDPERREIDALLDSQSKLAPEDIAAKTQVFTERYMVEWLLQNSLGTTWRAICRRHGWLSDVEGVLAVLQERRAERGRRRTSDDAAADEPLPLNAAEEAWKYLVDRPIPEKWVDEAPESVRGLKLLDPACGSGHFLVIAFDLLTALYREEARHLGTKLSDKEIAESILENNLHGIDIDPRAIQIAAAGLYLKAKSLSKDARPTRINLVAPSLQLGQLPPNDPAVTLLRQDLRREVGIPEELITKLLSALAGVNHLGSLLKVDAAVEEAIATVEAEFTRTHGQGNLFTGFPSKRIKQSVEDARATVLSRVEGFLAAHSSSEDLGLRLDGEQLSAGLRFLHFCRPGAYDIVVGNPPYFGTQSLADTEYIDSAYPQSKENLCTALFERATELARPGGQVAFVTVRNWLYVSQLASFRGSIFRVFPPFCAADLGLGGFEALPGVEAMMVVVRRGSGTECTVADTRDGSSSEKAAALALATTTFRTDPALLARLPGSPFVYRWSKEFIEDFLSRPLLGEVAPVRVGMKTSDNLRFLRCPWELRTSDAKSVIDERAARRWAPYVKGAAGKVWIEPLADVIDWRDSGLGVRIALDAAYGQGPQGEKHFFKEGVAFSTIGRSFIARAHRYPSIFDVAGSSVFPPDVAATVCLLNSRFAREVVQDLNPTINFQVGDVARIPYRPDERAAEVFRVLQEAFVEHEATDELSPNFKRPAPSRWRYAQAWAQEVVDSAETDGLEPYAATAEPSSPFAFLSFALGVAFGRFGADGRGWMEAAPNGSLPSGVLFLSARRKDDEAVDSRGDGLDLDACALLRQAWKQDAHTLGDGDDLRTFLRKSFFEAHKKLYENRPIYFPLSSARKSFVAFVSIHRWAGDTLKVVLADHLVPERRALEGEVEDIQKARAEAAGTKTTRGERRLTELQRLLDELNEFITMVTEVAEKGPPPSDAGTALREVDASYGMDLDDGVMVNSSALWPLLEAQWKEPRKWWGQLASRSGPKGTHFDWSSTAGRYFPTRVQAACAEDPVLAVAHRCLWRAHPKVALEWELRLQHEIRSDFMIEEPDADAARRAFLEGDPDGARVIRDAEIKRRARRGRARGSKAEPGAADD